MLTISARPCEPLSIGIHYPSFIAVGHSYQSVNCPPNTLLRSNCFRGGSARQLNFEFCLSKPEYSRARFIGWGSSVSIVTRQQAEQPRDWGSIPCMYIREISPTAKVDEALKFIGLILEVTVRISTGIS